MKNMRMRERMNISWKIQNKGEFLCFISPLVTLALSFLLFLILLFPLPVHAEPEKFYNVEITIDRADDDQFYEKIEVYVERNGEYYADYDLNRDNHYTYQADWKPGEYQVSARVRYDQLGTYTVTPECQSFTMTATEYKDMHTALFFVTGGTDPDEGHELQESTETSDQVYTMDQIEELYEMQDEYQSQAANEMQENDKWEQEHSFLARNQIADRNDTADNLKDRTPEHVYPEESEISTTNESENEKSFLEQEEKQESNGVVQSDDPAVEKGHPWFVSAILIIVLLVGVLLLIKRFY